MLYSKAYKLLYYIVKNFKANFRRPPNRTELIKMLYLSDLEYYRRYGEKYSELRYIFYNYGPWTRQFHQLLDYMLNEELVETRRDSGEAQWLYAVTNKNPRHDADLTKEIHNTVEDTLFIYNDFQLSQILKVVYTTEPMASTKRGEEIDFQKAPLHARKMRLEYMTNRKKRLDQLAKQQNEIGDPGHDIELLEKFKPYRDRANETLC